MSRDEKHAKICAHAAVDEEVKSSVAQVEGQKQLRTDRNKSSAGELVPAVDANGGSWLPAVVAVQQEHTNSHLSSASTPPVISSDRGDRGIKLPASSVKKARAEEILGVSLQGRTAAHDVTVYPESCPVGILVQALRTQRRRLWLVNNDKDGNPFVWWHSVLHLLKGGMDRGKRTHYRSVEARFPDFPGMQLFLSRHRDVFVCARMAPPGPDKIYLKDPASHLAVSDEQFTKICALVDRKPSSAQQQLQSRYESKSAVSLNVAQTCTQKTTKVTSAAITTTTPTAAAQPSPTTIPTALKLSKCVLSPVAATATVTTRTGSSLASATATATGAAAATDADANQNQPSEESLQIDEDKEVDKLQPTSTLAEEESVMDPSSLPPQPTSAQVTYLSS